MAFQVRASDDRVLKLFNRGNAMASKGQYREALRCFDKVLSILPGHLDALNNRGNCLSLLGRHPEAIATFDRLLAARPGDLRALANRASDLKQIGRVEEAIADYDRVLAAAPNYADALYNRGNTYIDIRRPREAIRDLRRALALLPSDIDVHTSLIYALNFDSEETAEGLQAERTRWAAPYSKLSAGARHHNDRSPHRRLRVGYVSSYFRHQAATYSFGGVIVHHDPEQFEVICYSDTPEEDDLTVQLRRCAARWHRTGQLSDGELADLVRTDAVDILVDLVGHMKGHRLAAFARKPAPVQVSAWGEPTGTGLRAVDYLLVDPVVIPQSERALLAEQVVDLPNFIGFWSPDPLPDPGPPPALERGYTTFGSFNRLAKITDEVLRCWAAIMRAVSGSRLVLKDRPLAPDYQKGAILHALGQEGISADRVTLLDQVGRAAHFDAYRDIDIALDPFPHGGGMTTLDALWMGVPTVTVPGRIISSRIAAASLSAAGLAELIAADRNRYIELAVSMAGDPALLARLRSILRDRMAATDFGDPARYARSVERQYRSMWRKWCESRPAGG